MVWNESQIHSDKTVIQPPLVVILHGLEGSIRSPYAKGLLNAVTHNGWSGVLMHFRGCSGRHNRLDRSYHSGDTNDLHSLLVELKRRYPDKPITAIGISLGGNVLLKYLGEQQSASLLTAVMAVSVPFDLADGARQLNKGLSRIYQRHLISHIRNKMKDKFKHKPAPINMNEIDKWCDFFSFDDNVTAPIHGFLGVNDYYTRSSSKPYIKDIVTPTYILHSRDDPFMSHAAIPVETELSVSTTLELSENGGHVGFVYQDNNKQAGFWIEKQMSMFFNRVMNHSEADSTGESW